MRWLFALILLLNLVILAWGVQREPDFSTPQGVARTGVGNIRLLSEFQVAKGQDDTGNPVQKNQADPEGFAVNSQGRVTPPGANDMDDFGYAEDVTGAAPPVAPEKVVEDPAPMPPTAVAKTAEGDTQGAPDAPPADQAVEAPGLVASCGAFGPFQRGAIGREVIDLLNGRGFDASLRRDSLDKTVGYWVVIPPLKDRETALAKVARLRESGITDIRRFVKGEQKNGISLGVFSSRENALKRQKAVSAKGHSSRIIPRTITLPIYWVDYRADRGRVEQAEADLAIRYPEMKNERYPCSRVVTPGGIF